MPRPAPAYIHSEKDILKLVNTLITNTKGEGKGGDDFWLKAETLLYTALIGYIYYEAPKEEQNFATLVEFINAMEVREDDETFENNVDIAFRELGERDPNHFAVRQWRKYKLAAGKTAKSINISAGARLAPFDIQELREITMYDELELDIPSAFCRAAAAPSGLLRFSGGRYPSWQEYRPDQPRPGYKDLSLPDRYRRGDMSSSPSRSRTPFCFGMYSPNLSSTPQSRGKSSGGGWLHRSMGFEPLRGSLRAAPIA